MSDTNNLNKWEVPIYTAADLETDEVMLKILSKPQFAVLMQELADKAKAEGRKEILEQVIDFIERFNATSTDGDFWTVQDLRNAIAEGREPCKP